LGFKGQSPGVIEALLLTAFAGLPLVALMLTLALM
jgi:hypothetical protein